jgi:putative transposase
VLLKRIYVLVFIEHGTRRIHLGGVAASPTGEWTMQQARNLALGPGEDRTSPPHSTPSSRPPVPRSCTPPSRLRERLVGTLRRELPGRVLILGERHLRAVLAEYQTRYNTARPHQGIAQHIPDGEPGAPRATLTGFSTQQIRRKPVLGGLINEYAHGA